MASEDAFSAAPKIYSVAGYQNCSYFHTAVEEAEKELNKKAKDFTWMDIIVYLSPKVNATAFKALCSIGFFSTGCPSGCC